MPHRFWQSLLVRAGGTLCLCLALIGGPGAAPTAQATPAGTITVTNLSDIPGAPGCILRDAIIAANTNSSTGNCPAGTPGPDTIIFNLQHPSCSIVICVITLGGPLPAVLEDLTISGAGGTIILSGGGATRLLNVGLEATLHVQDLTLEDANSGASDGGAISNHGNLWLESSTIQDSHTDAGHSGGAIFTNGPVTLTNSLLQFNTGGSGGALFANFANAVVTISNTTFLHNQAVNTTTTGYGGAIWVGSQAQVTITGGAILSNTAINGGGIYLSPGAAVTLTASGPPATMSGNTSNLNGGGIFNEQGTASLTNAALIGNQSLGGGGIINLGALTVAHSTLSGNVAEYGGALLNGGGGSAAVADSTLSGNTSSDSGGGIINLGILAATNVTFSDNSGPIFGGGLANRIGSATLMNVTFSGNTAAEGGGLDNDLSGIAALTNATFSGNTATDGGGIQISSGAITLTNGTFFSNTAVTAGGGVRNDQGAATLVNVTLDGNSATSGAELAQNGSQVTETITVLNTIVGPSASGANCFVDAASVVTPTSGGYNLSSDGTCAPYFNQTGDVNNANPNLGPLANNGGQTLTQLPQPPSPAIDAIPADVNGCGTFINLDQRGVKRPINGRCDIGAVETGFVHPVLWLPVIRR